MDDQGEPLDVKTFRFADYAVFAFMLLISTSIGVFYAWKDRNESSNKAFLTANRSLHLFPVAMSLLASFQSSVTILGYPAEMFLRGTQFWAVILSGMLAAFVAAEVFLPVYYKLSFTSVNKYLRLRFGSDRVRVLSSVTFLLGTIPYMGVVLYGPALALSSVTPLDIPTSIFLIGFICTFYTSIGGIKAVVWTDTIQVFLMFAGLMAVMLRGFSLSGGVGEAFRIAQKAGRIEFFKYANQHTLSSQTLTLMQPTTYGTVSSGMGIMWCGNYCTSQTEVQRYCNVRSQKQAKLALYVNMVGMIMLLSLACLCGIALHGVYHDCDPLKLKLIDAPDQLMPFFVMDKLSIYPGVPGLFVSCVFSAALSTMSSGFNALATVTWDDFLKHTAFAKRMKDNQVKTACKLIAASYGLLSIAMAFFVGRVGSVLQAAISLAGALFGPLFGLYILGILVPFANGKGVVTGLLLGQLFTIWVTIGSLMYPVTLAVKDTFIDQCPSEFLSLAQNTTISAAFVNDNTGALAVYHMAYLLVPVTGFLISSIVGFTVSILTGGFDNVPDMNPYYLSPLAWYIWPSSWVPKRRRDESVDLVNISDDTEFDVKQNLPNKNGTYEITSLRNRSPEAEDGQTTRV
ncbi:Sodium-coupled monocarboxylate transporter 1 [Halotydeus destructor]|nr:Sodium-coupled monocarboxylate transporter 1 [Halotydeus destructor]